MTEDSSRSFGSIWKGAVDSVSSKTVKFMPNITKVKGDKSTEKVDSSGLTQKQKRRAQVRKAQIEHRQRKQNYVKHLEQDVINLRGMIAAVETQTVAFKDDNQAIRDRLAKEKVAVEITAIPVQELEHDFSNLLTHQTPPSAENTVSPEPKREIPGEGSEPDMMQVTANFDEFLDAICLQVSPLDTPNSHFAVPAVTSIPGLTPDVSQPTIRDVVPDAALQSTATSNLETMGINFILALEHCCRTHFKAHSHTFDPEGKPSGHTLMASTMLYDSAPPAIFESLSAPTSPPPATTTAPSPNQSSAWHTPSSSLTLASLHGLSKSLPKSDWEITPVQAWFKLVEYVGEDRLREGNGKVLELLKSGLGKLTGCWHFGATMNEVLFWDVVNSVLSGEGAGVGG